MQSISDLSERTRPGTIVITFTKKLNSIKFELCDKTRLRMSWGPATVYVHRRLGLDGSPYGGFSLDAWKRSPLFNRPRTISRPLLELTRCVASEVSPGTLIRCIYHVRKPIKASIGEVTPSELKYLFRAPKDFNVTN